MTWKFIRYILAQTVLESTIHDSFEVCGSELQLKIALSIIYFGCNDSALSLLSEG